MDTIIFEVLSVNTLKQIRSELTGYMLDQLRDVDNNTLRGVDEAIFDAYLKLQQVLSEKE
jgi:hypothetical protein